MLFRENRVPLMPDKIENLLFISAPVRHVAHNQCRVTGLKNSSPIAKR